MSDSQYYWMRIFRPSCWIQNCDIFQMLTIMHNVDWINDRKSSSHLFRMHKHFILSYFELPRMHPWYFYFLMICIMQKESACTRAKQKIMGSIFAFLAFNVSYDWVVIWVLWASRYTYNIFLNNLCYYQRYRDTISVDITKWKVDFSKKWTKLRIFDPSIFMALDRTIF